MSEHIESIFLAAFFFPAAAAVLIFFMKYVSAVLQARVRLGQDEAYRAIATQAAAAQTEMAAALVYLAIPWRYVFVHYVQARGDHWRWKPSQC
jgi:hypothetical protein